MSNHFPPPEQNQGIPVPLGQAPTQISGFAAPPAGSFQPPPMNSQFQFSPPPMASAGGDIPTGLKTLAIIVSGMKAIPLVLLTLLAVILGSISGAFDADEVDQFGNSFAMVVFVFFALGAVLIIGQIIAASKSSKVGLIVFASIMTAIDVIWLILFTGAAIEDSARKTSETYDDFWLVIVLLPVAVPQVAILVWAIVAKPKQLAFPSLIYRSPGG